MVSFHAILSIIIMGFGPLATALNNVTIVPMLRHTSDTRGNLFAVERNEQGALSEMGKLRAIGAASALYNSYDIAYYTSVQIGNPPVWFSVVIDTGSADLWIPSTKYSKPDDAKVKARYDCKMSSTSSPLGIPVTTWYGIGSATGTIVADTVRFGGVESTGHVFILADTSSNVQPAGIDGLIGMGFSGMSWANSKVPNAMVGKSSLVENSYRNKQIAEPAFGVWLDSYVAWNAAPDSVVGGELALGSSSGNPARYTGPIVWLNVPTGTTGWWQVQWDGLQGPDGIELKPAGRSIRGLVDTGTALILVDYAVAEKLNRMIGAYSTNIRGLWGVNCNTLRQSSVVFTITLQGNKFNLTGADMPTRVWADDPNTCYAPFQAKFRQDVLDHWQLGVVFLRKYYQIYDYNPAGGWKPRIGFAAAAR